jgi:heterodisulfide reductase subunit C
MEHFEYPSRNNDEKGTEPALGMTAAAEGRVSEQSFVADMKVRENEKLQEQIIKTGNDITRIMEEAITERGKGNLARAELLTKVSQALTAELKDFKERETELTRSTQKIKDTDKLSFE